MKAILLKDFGGPEQLYIGDAERPVPGPKQLLVRVHATALNRADTLQRKGMYPPPAGASPILGLEMAGVVEAVGKDCELAQPGIRVCALLSGGGYAEYVVIDEAMAIAIPNGWSFEQAAAMPEVFLTAFQALDWLAGLGEGEHLLIHAGASGVGTAAIQIARAKGARVWVTASSGKHEACLSLGAERTIDYRSEQFEEVIATETQGKGVDVVLDFLAASYFQGNLNSLAMDGRMVMLALMGGVKADDLNLGNILRKRLHIMGSTLRSRTPEYKAALTNDFCEFALPLFESGSMMPVVDSVWDWKEVAAAHTYMESNKNTGKIVLSVIV